MVLKLNAQHSAFFRDPGYIKFKQALNSQTLARYGTDITRLTIELNTQAKPLKERSTIDRPEDRHSVQQGSSATSNSSMRAGVMHMNVAACRIALL